MSHALHDWYLRFVDETAARAALAIAGVAPGGGRGVAVDMLGPVTLTPSEIDPETGEVLTPAVIDHRYHVNLRSAELPAALTPFLVSPAVPAVRFTDL